MRWCAKCQGSGVVDGRPCTQGMPIRCVILAHPDREKRLLTFLTDVHPFIPPGWRDVSAVGEHRDHLDAVYVGPRWLDSYDPRWLNGLARQAKRKRARAATDG